MNQGQNSSDVAGAIYCEPLASQLPLAGSLIVCFPLFAVITNEPTGNFIVAAGVSSTGQVVS